MGRVKGVSRSFLHWTNANVDGGWVGSQLVREAEGVCAGILLLHSSDDEGGQVLSGLNVEATTSRHLDGFSATGPLYIFSIAGEGAGHGQDLAGLDADVLRQGLDPRSTTWWTSQRKNTLEDDRNIIGPLWTCSLLNIYIYYLYTKYCMCISAICCNNVSCVL